MDDALEEALYCTIMAVVGIERKETEKRFWCKNWLQRRGHRGSFSQIFSELAVERPLDFENYIRMPMTVFYNLLTKVEPHIRKEDTDMRESISPGACLEATLRFLAAGGSYTNLQYSTRISKQSLSQIIPETCEAIYTVLKKEYSKVSKVLCIQVTLVSTRFGIILLNQTNSHFQSCGRK